METQPTLQFDVLYPDRLSRLLIFVKWLLAIPHYFVLVLLGIASVFVTLIAWIAILISGNYPRGLFEFQVMVLQWGARVTGYVDLWTDVYPPFGEEGHPVNLSLEYPPHLSRLLNFIFIIKWILAIPHFIILYILGIVSRVITLIAFFAILITGRYPRSMFDFQVGFYRWSYRVTAYVGLMTDAYPPFNFGEPPPASGPPAEYVPPPQGVQPNF
ncbi:MAG: DUF4389 domain-containing protein [Thermomicrobiales bacterium]